MAQAVIDAGGSALHGPAGPTWYRGTAACSEVIEADALSVALEKIGASRVVMGHTTTITRSVQQRMNGRVVEIDTGMLKRSYDGSGNALIIEDGELTVINQDGTRDVVPTAHPVRVGHESIPISDDELADILLNGELVASNSYGVARKLVQVTAGEHTVSGYFVPASKENGSVPELAAYRLDRILGLGMVPVTVRRKIEGQMGTLQYVPVGTMTERERVASGKGRSMPCSLDKQLAGMYVFDALTHNSGRTPSSMLYSPDDWLLILTDHENAFGAESEFPDYLDGVELRVGDQWRTVLFRLDNEVLDEALGDALNETSLEALLHRKDALIRSSLH
jgi:hypothetical protein